MASDPGPGEPAKSAAEKKPSLEFRIALIGVLGALAGTLAGGLITWAVTQDQVAAQRSDARRAEKLDAYATYFGDAARLWTQVFNVYEVTPRPTRLSAADSASLETLMETLTRDYALVALLAPDRVREVARQLNNANTAVGNALRTIPIDRAGYTNAMRRAAARENSLLPQFLNAAKEDLGTEDR